MLRALVIAAGAFALVACSTAPPPAGSVNADSAYAVALSDVGRPTEDMAKDAARKPAETLAFAKILPGQTVGEVLPGRGYYTRILSKVVGPRGKVVALVAAETAARNPRALEGIRGLMADPAYANVVLETPPGGAASATPLDVLFVSQFYHDIHAFQSAEAAAAFNRAAFAALKPGGYYVIIDHASAPGAGVSVSKTLHRIEVSSVKQEVLAAGFVLDAESDLLKDPADTHALNVFDPAIRGKTDQFLLRFRKP